MERRPVSIVKVVTLAIEDQDYIRQDEDRGDELLNAMMMHCYPSKVGQNS